MLCCFSDPECSQVFALLRDLMLRRSGLHILGIACLFFRFLEC